MKNSFPLEPKEKAAKEGGPYISSTKRKGWGRAGNGKKIRNGKGLLQSFITWPRGVKNAEGTGRRSSLAFYLIKGRLTLAISFPRRMNKKRQGRSEVQSRAETSSLKIEKAGND